MIAVYLFVQCIGAVSKKWFRLAITATTLWCVCQLFLTESGFYRPLTKGNVTSHVSSFSPSGAHQLLYDDAPPRLLLFGVIPAVVLLTIPLFRTSTRQLIVAIPMESLVWIHAIRLPIEVLLYQLYYDQGVPRDMTFEGRNFDIIMGLTAPIMALIGLKKFTRIHFIAWNVTGLLLLANVVTIGVLSAPTPLQSMNFSQPNVAIFHSPYVLITVLFVPLVLWSHVVSLVKLLKR